jgi:1-phosphatidylinositol phosphodiesterase
MELAMIALSLPRIRIALLFSVCWLALPVKAAVNLDLPNWLGHMPGTWRLSLFGLPGTHDAGARVDPVGLPDTAKAQDLSIAQQLAIGVRFLDIRCRRVNNTDMAIHHGPIFQKIWLGSGVIEPIRAFLRAHPTETVILSIKDEYGPTGAVTLPFEQILYNYLRQYPADDRAGKFKGWYTRNSIPTLDEVRGKIVLFRRFDHVSKITRCAGRSCVSVNVTTPTAYRVGGIDAWSTWPKGSVGGTGLIRVEDDYKDPGQANKWNVLKSALSTSINDARSNKPLYISFSSATRNPILHRHPITYYSDYINLMLWGYVSPLGWGYGLGIVVMDHVNIGLTSQIIDVMTPYRH